MIAMKTNIDKNRNLFIRLLFVLQRYKEIPYLANLLPDICLTIRRQKTNYLTFSSYACPLSASIFRSECCSMIGFSRRIRV